MPTVSEKQKKFMQAAAHNPKFAKDAGIPQKVAKEFVEADKEKDAKKKKKTASTETYTTTASISGPRGFRDQ